MPGLYATLNLGVRALETQSAGMAVTGQNLANVNNPTYTRQRLLMQTMPAALTTFGLQGAGVTPTGIEAVRDTLVDRQIQAEASVSGFWNAQHSALESLQAELGESIDSSTASATGTEAAGGAGAASTLSRELAAFFNGWQTLAASPASLPQRNVLLTASRSLADRLNEIASRLDATGDSLREAAADDIAQANELIVSIADLSAQIQRAETAAPGSANDLRDRRREKLEALGERLNLEVAEDADGRFSLSVGGTPLVSGGQVLDTLELRDAGDGQLSVQTAQGGVALTLTGGCVQGTIDARDGALATVRQGLDALAATLVDRVNALHRSGYDPQGNTGLDFFEGNDAATIRVSATLIQNPSRLQASADPTAPGGNEIALALGSLNHEAQSVLGGQTFGQSLTSTVTGLGTALAHASSQVEDQQVMTDLLRRQRASVSGVSLDEEMASLVKYQKAFQASARIVSVIDEMLSEVINLQR